MNRQSPLKYAIKLPPVNACFTLDVADSFTASIAPDRIHTMYEFATPILGEFCVRDTGPSTKI
jgi:hypothetical protein